MFQGKRLHCEFVCDELCSHPCLNLPCVSMSVYAGCCLCIHSSTEGPAMRTECPPPLAPQCAWHASLCQLSSPSLCLPCFPVIRHHPPYHAPSLVQTDTHSHDSTHIALKWTAFPETPAPLRSKYNTRKCTRPHISMYVYIKISWARAFAYPYTECTDHPKHSQKQTTLHMHAQTWAYSHSLTGSCVLFVRNPLHLFLPSRLTKACLSLGTLTHAHSHCFDV